VRPDCILTTNTSSIPAERIFAEVQHPGRTTVTHFFAPAWRNLLVEVIRWAKADDEVVDFLYWFFAFTGKAPIITDDAICFVLDHIFDNWCNESAYLLDAATASEIDKVAEEFVFAGPFFVLNLANGNPIIVETNTLQMEEGEHYRPANVLNSVGTWNTHKPGQPVEVSDAVKQQVRDRLLGILFSQSYDIIDRGIGTAADLNFGCQVALGMRAGPLDIMRDLGADEVARISQRFTDERAGFPSPGASFDEYQNFRRTVQVDLVDGVAIITVRRPQAMNALSDEINNEILSVLQQYADDAVKGFVITGYGTKAFSAGADIGKFPSMLGDHQASVDYSRDCAQVQRYMDRMTKPVVAAINGLALGGGLEVAIRCHRMVATKNARLQFPEINLGILPGIGGCVVPYRKWPQGAELFHEMICLGRSIKASEALEVGMVSQLCDDYPSLIAAAIAEVNALVGKAAPMGDGAVEIPPVVLPDEPMSGRLALSKEAVGIIAKTITEAAASESFDAALEIGYQGFGQIACTDAAKEGIGAFLGKRPPVFAR
jgi:enoyl-CoA hydratase/3-hydroxyacyl-CoA dehydrogenase